MELVHKEISEEIIGASFFVHNTVGPGHREVVYQRALASEMESRNLDVKQQYRVPLIFRHESMGTAIVDFCVNDCVLVEIKNVDRFRTGDFRQMQGYLKATRFELGLLIAFGYKNVKFKRVVNLKGYTPEPP